MLLQFTDELLDQLDRLTTEQGRSRSAVVRDAVARYVIEESRDLKDRRMAEAYERIPDDDEFDRWASGSSRDLVEEEPW